MMILLIHEFVDISCASTHCADATVVTD